MAFKCDSCGRKFITQAFLDKHLATYPKPNELKRKGWVTPYGFMDFTDPVTYEEACEVAKKFHQQFKEKLNANQ